MDSLRIVLIIVAALVIVASLIHGILINKKERSSLFENSNRRELIPDGEYDDVSGIEDDFEDGVGSVRVVQSAKRARNQPASKKQPYGNMNYAGQQNQPPQQRDLFGANELTGAPNNIASLRSQSMSNNGNTNVKSNPRQATSASSKRPIITEEDVTIIRSPYINKYQAEANRQKLVNQIRQSEQQQAPFDSEYEQQPPNPQPNRPQSQARVDTQPQQTNARLTEPAAEEAESEVLVLNVSGLNGRELRGDILLNSILNLGFHFGDMKIFHRHQDREGNGYVLFSLANMVKPGYLDPDTMHEFTTPGVSLFMIISSGSDDLQIFKFMLQTAQRIADDVNGVVLDNNLRMLTPQKIVSYKNRIEQRHTNRNGNNLHSLNQNRR